MDNWYTASQVSIAGLTSALRDPRLRWVFAERREDIVLTWRDALLDNSVGLERWTHGRAFSPALELAWWRSEGQVTARAVVVEGAPPAGVEWQPYPTNGWEPQSLDGQATLLVGECDGPEPRWSEARIPRYLEYPVEGIPKRVALVKQAYRQRGIVVAWRLVEVKGAE